MASAPAAAPPLRRSPPARVLFLGAVGLLLFLLLRLVALGGEASAFTVAGDGFADPDRVPAELVVRPDSNGYDGQFVYRLALNPLTSVRTEFGITLDSPAYRQQRIALPAAAWVVHTLTPLPVGVALLLVSGGALLAAIWFAAHLAMSYGRAPWWGLAIALPPGVVVSLALDLNEPLAWSLGLAGLWAFRERRWAWGALAFSGAVLARETMIVIPAGLGIWQLARVARHRPVQVPAMRWLLVPLAVLVGWQALLWARWGALPFTAGAGNVGTPLVGLLRSLFGGELKSAPGLSQNPLLHAVWVLERLWLLAVFLYAALAVRRSRLDGGTRMAWALATLLALSSAAWTHDAQFLRATNEGICLSLLLAGADPHPASVVVLGTAALGSIGVAAMYVVIA